jgi:transitional endoplasmic reticulum ATPase
MKGKGNVILKSIGVLFLVLIGLTLLSSCSEQDVYTYPSSMTQEVERENSRTKISFALNFQNDYIIDIDGISLKFDIYNSQTLVLNDYTVTYDFTVSKNSTQTLNGYFYIDEEATSIEYEDFRVHFISFWDSYQPWLIGAIVGASLIALIGVIIIFVKDLEIDDFGEWISDNLWLLFVFVIPFIPTFISSFSVSSWISAGLVLGGIVAGVIPILLTFLIRYLFYEFDSAWLVFLGIIALVGGIVCGFIFWIWWAMLIIILGIGLIIGLIFLIKYIIENRNVTYSTTTYSYNDEDDLESWTVSDLKDYCRDNGIRGYSQLNKAELIELINNSNEEDEEEEVEEEKDTAKSSNSNKSRNAKSKNSDIPTIKLDDIAGLDEAKKQLEEKVIMPLKHPDIFAKYGKKVGGGILLYGLPGTGKTMFAQAVATELNAHFYSIKCSDIESKWIGESEQNIRDLFKKARSYPVSVIFFDEFDSIGMKRSEENVYGAKTVQEILTQMNGVEESKNMLLVIAATNCPWMLDGALLRPGRFSEKIYIPLPDNEARLFILKKNLKNIKFENGVELSYISDKIDGFSGADVSNLCEKIKMIIIKKEIAKDNNPIVSKDDTDGILKETHSSILDRDIESMENYRSE